MAAKAKKRSGKKRVKSAKRGAGKRAAPAKHYPITETLEWVAEGEQLLRKWGALKSPYARKIATGFEKILAVLKTVDEVRKM